MNNTNKNLSDEIENISLKKRTLQKLGKISLSLLSAALVIGSAGAAASPSLCVACGILIAKTLG